jgi:arylsulfatase A-like enzyme
MSDNKNEESRRAFLKVGAGTVGSLAASSQVFPREAPARKPNIVFIMTDGHRPEALSLNGHPFLQTPHLDLIGREGIQFRNSFVVNALCLPGRATCLTGLYSHTTGAIDNQERVIPQNIPLVSDLLRSEGYEVAMCGKAHIGGALRDRYWDYYFGFGGAAADYFWPNVPEGRNGKIGESQIRDGFVDDLVADRALGWLREKREKPFCLFLWFQSPHAPFFRPRRYMDLYNGIPVTKPATFDDDLKGYPGKPRAFANADNKIGPYVKQSRTKANCARSLEELAKDYYVGIKAVDDSVGRLWQTLAETGHMDDTVVVFTADHGFFMGEWRMYDKRLMHEPSIRTPLLIRYPKLIKPGSVCDKMALNLDFAPTFLELAGAKVPERMQGHSLIPLLKGEQPSNWRKDWLYEYYEYPGPHNVRKNRGVRTDRYKFIHYWEAPEEFELYDLEKDPGELHNLYGQPRYAELTQHLRTRLQELRQETGDTSKG